MAENSTGKECHNCGYVRQATDKAAASRCPRCGNDYHALAKKKSTKQHYPENWRVQAAHHPLRIIQTPLLYRLARLSNYFIFISLILLGLSFWYKGTLPPQSEMKTSLYKAALLEDSTQEPYSFEQNYRTIEIEPVADIVISGLIMDYNDHDSVIWQYADGDFRVKNICFIWGENLSPETYPYFTVKSSKQTCHVSAKGHTNATFHYDNFASMQLLSTDDAILKLIAQLNIGDQVMLIGSLVNYRDADSVMGTWHRSAQLLPYLSKTPHNYLFVEGIYVIEAGTPKWHALYDVSWVFFILLLIFRIGLLVLDVVLQKNKK